MRYRIKFRYKSLSCFLLRHTSLPKKVVKKYVGKRWSNQSAIDAVRTIYYRIINKQQTNF